MSHGLSVIDRFRFLRIHQAESSALTGGESGSSLVEFTLILPVFVALLLGMLTAGLAYDHKQELTNASQQAARYGSTLTVSQCANLANCGGMTWAQLVQSIAVDRSNGVLSTSDVCVALVSGPGTSPIAYDSTHTTAGGTNPCFIDNNADSGYRVQVSVTSTSTLNAFFFSHNLSLGVQSEAVYEDSPG